MDRNPKTPLEEIFEDDYLTRLGIRVASPPASHHPANSRLCSTPNPMRSLMVASVDFDFHHSFLIILALFAAFVLAVSYLFCLFTSALLVYRECVTPNGGCVC
jgi:hypothetical protein